MSQLYNRFWKTRHQSAQRQRRWHTLRRRPRTDFCLTDVIGLGSTIRLLKHIYGERLCLAHPDRAFGKLRNRMIRQQRPGRTIGQLARRWGCSTNAVARALQDLSEVDDGIMQG